MKYIKLFMAALLSVLYYIAFCWILGFDFGDPWRKLMTWAKKQPLTAIRTGQHTRRYTLSSKASYLFGTSGQRLQSRFFAQGVPLPAISSSDTSKISAIAHNSKISGILFPTSQLESVCLFMYIFCASCSCVIFRCPLRDFILRPIILSVIVHTLPSQISINHPQESLFMLLTYVDIIYFSTI